MNLKPLLRLLIVTQSFLLFAVVFLPLLIHSLHQTAGKVLYGCLAAACIALALRLRRALTELEM
jgi:hypothetical protein